MKILQLIDSLNPGGAERMAVNLANAFKNEEIENILVISREKGQLGDLVEDQDHLYWLGKKSTFDRIAFRALLKRIDEFKPTIFHAHGTSIYWGLAAKFFRPKLKLIWHDHLGISEEVLKNNPRAEMKLLNRWVDLLITADQNTQDYWRGTDTLVKERIRFLPNFPSIREKKKVATERFTFLHLANYREEKGQDFLIEVSRLLKDQGLDFSLRMVGLEVDPSWKKAVKEKVAKMNLEKLVFVEGAVADVSEMLYAVDAGLVASDREGLPVALLEYGLAGLPVISTRVGQCPQVLENGKFGQLVEPRNVREYAEAMGKLIQNHKKEANPGVAFSKHVKKNYGPDKFLKDYVSLLGSLFEN